MKLLFLLLYGFISNAFIGGKVNGQLRYSVVITELFPDPLPSIGLPEYEFIELKNISNHAVDMFGWQISDGVSTGVIRDRLVLQPDSLLILTTSAGLHAYKNFGNAIAVSNFPALDNESDILILYNDNGSYVHAVNYDRQWYRNPVAENGGWTIEMIDPASFCSGKMNWQASKDLMGGTPGKANSVDAKNPDLDPPVLVRTYSIDRSTLIACFDEALDSSSATSATSFTLDNMRPNKAEQMIPQLNKLKLTFPPLEENRVFLLTVSNIRDCAGNEIGIFKTSPAGIKSKPGVGDIVFNELLFNPAADGTDFIEILNISKKIIDLADLFVANESSSGNTSNLKPLISESWFLYPGDIICISTEPSFLKQHYSPPVSAKFLEVTSLPPMPDDKGVLKLLGKDGVQIDIVSYNKDWHSPLLVDDEGVSIERINYSLVSNDSRTWTSASSITGYATPGYRNSQHLDPLSGSVSGIITLSSPTFAPGNMESLGIYYRLEYPDMKMTMEVIDITGRMVRRLLNNISAGREGMVVWDGLDDRRQLLPVGVYVIVTRIFALTGMRKNLYTTCTLAKRF